MIMIGLRLMTRGYVRSALGIADPVMMSLPRPPRLFALTPLAPRGLLAQQCVAPGNPWAHAGVDDIDHGCSDAGAADADARAPAGQARVGGGERWAYSITRLYQSGSTAGRACPSIRRP